MIQLFRRFQCLTQILFTIIAHWLLSLIFLKEILKVLIFDYLCLVRRSSDFMICIWFLIKFVFNLISFYAESKCLASGFFISILNGLHTKNLWYSLNFSTEICACCCPATKQKGRYHAHWMFNNKVRTLLACKSQCYLKRQRLLSI